MTVVQPPSRLVPVWLAVALAACASCATATTRADADDLPRVGAPAGAAIRIALSPARDVVSLQQGGDTAVLRGVRFLDGVLDDVRGDTALVLVTAAFRAGSSTSLAAPGATAVVVLDSAASVTVLSRNPRGVELGLAVTILLAASAVALLIALARGLVPET